nr:reverse transcriptase domain-containing protein [Tanacetum cinerariifolium]
MSMMGVLTYFLGFQIKQSERGISINQENYVKDLQKKYDIDGSIVKTPMIPSNKLGPDLNGKAINETRYRGMIGLLIYLTVGRPDIQFSTCLYARYQANPKESHLIAVKRIVKTSTLGACHLLERKLVCWSTKKQQSIAMSLAKAEYVAAVRCYVNILGMKSQLTDYDIIYEKCMQTRYSLKFVGAPSINPISTNPKRRNLRRSKPRVEPFSLEETPVVTMADQRPMAELLRAPIEGYAEEIIVPPILAEHFELKHSLINLVTSKQFFGFKKEDPHAHIRYFNKITSTLKNKDVPEYSIKLMLFSFSIDGLDRIWLDKEPSRSILTWDDLVSKFINHFFPLSKTTNLRNEILNFQQKFEETFSEAWDHFKDLLRTCPHHGVTKLHQLDTFYNDLNPSDQDSLNSAVSGNLLERSDHDVLKIIENKSKVCNSRNKLIVSQVKASNVDSSEIASAVASAVTSAMTAMFKKHQVTPALTFVKAVEESCVTCGGAHSYRQCPASIGNTFLGYQDNIQEYVLAAAVNYNQGNTEFFPQVATNYRANQISPPDALLHMPKFALMFRSILNNKEKLFDLATTLVNENCTAVILKKLPEKLRDSDKFLIPCDFSELVECLALADLGASINLMPLSIWKKLSLPERTPTRMILELADRSTTQPADIAKGIFVKVGKFYFLTDFVVVDYVVDLQTPLLLSLPHLTPFEGGDFILKEIEACLTSKSIPPGIDNTDFDLEGDIRLL